MKILSVLFVLAVVMFACQTKQAKQVEEAAKGVVVQNVGEYVLNVEGMTCDGCEKSVEAGLSKIEGVAEVKADHETGKTIVKADTLKVNTGDLAQMIVKIGYKVE